MHGDFSETRLVGWIDSKPFGEGSCRILAVHIFFYDGPGLSERRETSVYIVCVRERETDAFLVIEGRAA